MQAHPRAGRGAWRAPGWGRLGAGRLPEGPGTSAQSGPRAAAASETGPGRAPRFAGPERVPTGRRGWRDAAEAVASSARLRRGPYLGAPRAARDPSSDPPSRPDAVPRGDWLWCRPRVPPSARCGGPGWGGIARSRAQLVAEKRE